MTKRFTTAALLCGALALPAGAVAAEEPSQANFKNAAKYCKALKASAGDANFKAMFGGGNNAYGKCVSKAAQRDAKQEDQAKTNASKQCKAEAAADEAAFRAKYGTGKKGVNAHGKCVSQKAKANKAEADKQEKQDVSSAKECRTEQQQNPEEFKAAHGGKTFAEFYGTNENGKNAFGKCVSQKTREEESERKQAKTNAAKQCKEERGTTDASRQAFTQKYGTGKNGSNAFGKCVSAKVEEPDE